MQTDHSDPPSPSLDYPDPPSPPQGHTHRQYYGFLLPKDVTAEWHKIYCQIHGIDLQISHPLRPGRFLTLNSHPIARESLEKKIHYPRLYYEPVYTNDDLDEISTCIAFVQYSQKDSPHTVPRYPTKAEVSALEQELAGCGIHVGPSNLGWYSFVWSLDEE